MEVEKVTWPDLPKLRLILSTGSPLGASTFEYVYEQVQGETVRLASISGGTDIISLFVGGNPILPVYAGQIQCRCLGMAVDVVTSSGDSSESGDLVCRRPFPSMPVCFFGDDAERKIYRKAYFEKIPGCWYHGDYCKIDPVTGGIVMLGRSDATLNPAGIRFGSADLYSIIGKISPVDITNYSLRYTFSP